MKKLITALFILFSCFNYAQGEANNWYFGYRAGINFNNGAANAVSGSQIYTNEGCATFSKPNGDLLFYTDGIKVWDKNNMVMPNGTNLLGNPSSTQSAIIVPHPGNTNRFFIFTVGANDYDKDGNLVKSTDGLNYYTVDMSANAGLGDVIAGPVDLSNGKNASWTEKVTSVQGAECNTFWVISLVNNTFISYKIDDTGLITSPVISTVNYFETDPRGYLKASPNGKKIATAAQGNRGNLLLYSFNDMTGEVANDGKILISDIYNDGEPYGVEFSPKSTKLYCATYNYDRNLNNLFQFDLENSNIPSSKYLIKSQTGFRGALQLAPNGKIYATVPPDYYNGTRYLDAINLPDELGANCDYNQNAIDLGSGRAMQGLPPFIASLLLPVEITDGITTQNLNNTTVKRCVGENYQLKPQNIQGNPTFKWLLNGNIISTNQILTLNNLSTLDNGNYKVEIETIDDCGFRILYKGEIDFEVYIPPNLSSISNTIQCDNDGTFDGFFTFDLNNLKDAEILNNQNPSEYEVLYFNSLSDANNNINAISTPYKNSNAFGTETIFARIHNKFNPICYQTGSFELKVVEMPNPPAQIQPLTTCDSNVNGTEIDGFEIFNLKLKENEILNGQAASNFSIFYFSDSSYQNSITNPANYPNSIKDKQTIYIEIKNNAYPICSVNTSFDIIVNPLPKINDYFKFMQCDEDGNPDGFTNFNLNEANEYLTLGNNNLVVTYYLSKIEAENKVNAVNPFPFSNATQSSVFARIENINGCISIAQVELSVLTTSFPAGYLKTDSACDLDAIIDGFNLFDLSENDSEIINQFPGGQNLSVSYFRDLNDAQLEINKIPKDLLFQNETPFFQSLFVRVESKDNGECFGIGQHLNLVVQERPEFELDSTAIYCQNLRPITIKPYNAKGNYNYSWTNENDQIISNNEEVTISEAGNYTVIAYSEAGCESFPKTIVVKPSIIANISENDIMVTDDSENNSITIDTSNLGIGDYEFALDDFNADYQDSPFFENIFPGIHTLYIRDKNNCGISKIEVSIIGYPKFFTPNNDGYNDTWKILGVNKNFYSNTLLNIYNRFGKLVAQINVNGNGWDGTLNGKYLPSSDYWFSVELIDKKGNSRTKKGHFSLIRR